MNDLTTLQAQFESKLDTILGICRFQFRGLRPEARDEATANTLGLAWKYWLRLAETGKHEDEAVFHTMVYHATRHTRQGRLPQQRDKSKDVLVYAERGIVGRDIEFNVNHFVGGSTPVLDQVAYRLDTAAFLATLSDRQRGIAQDLANGMGTGEVAKKWSVSAGAISQFRTRFKDLYEQFHGEAA